MQYDFEHQILVGTILGGSSLVRPPNGKNYYLSMRSNNVQWLKYKMMEMPNYFPDPKVFLYGKTYRCNSICNTELTTMQSQLYEGKTRKITMEILDSLHDISIAIWFLESGSKTGRNKKNAYINTTKFGESGTSIILKYFNEVGMECHVNRDGKRLKIMFTVDGTIHFLKTIAHRFPNFMYDRL